MDIAVGIRVTVSVAVGPGGSGDRSVGTCVSDADGVFVSVKVGGRTGAVGCVVSEVPGAGPTAGENIRVTMGRPKNATETAANDKTRDTVNHCQPDTMRARRVR